MSHDHGVAMGVDTATGSNRNKKIKHDARFTVDTGTAREPSGKRTTTGGPAVALSTLAVRAVRKRVGKSA